MTKREKRLKKGIESIEKQIEAHETKKKIAEEEKNMERVDYYKKEIKKFIGAKEKKEKQLK